MGLREDIQHDVAEAFDTDLADAVVPVIGTRTIVTGYNPKTETSNTTIVQYQGRGVMDSYSAHLIDGVRIRAQDQKLIALANEILEQGTLAAFRPAIGDKINGYDVLIVEMDPAEAHYEIQLRKV